VHHYDDASEAMEAILDYPYIACVAKLGTKGNLGIDVIKCLREKDAKNGTKSFIIVHSTTAVDSKPTVKWLLEERGVDLVVDWRNEEELIQKLINFKKGSE